jgi:signal transduction histidine kinase
MRDRADGVGGRLTVQSEPGKGTVIEMEVPCG